MLHFIIKLRIKKKITQPDVYLILVTLFRFAFLKKMVNGFFGFLKWGVWFMRLKFIHEQRSNLQ